REPTSWSCGSLDVRIRCVCASARRSNLGAPSDRDRASGLACSLAFGGFLGAVAAVEGFGVAAFLGEHAEVGAAGRVGELAGDLIAADAVTIEDGVLAALVAASHRQVVAAIGVEAAQRALV